MTFIKLIDKMYKNNDDRNDLLAFHSVENYFLGEDIKEFIRLLKEDFKFYFKDNGFSDVIPIALIEIIENRTGFSDEVSK